MNVAIRFYSKTGNTEKIAKAIAEAVGVEALDLLHPIEEETDILFLANSVYYAGMDKEVKTYVENLNPNLVKKIVNVSSAAIKESTFAQMKQLAEKNGLNLSDKEFHCKGEFTALHRGKPDNNDLQDAKNFACECIKEAE